MKHQFWIVLVLAVLLPVLTQPAAAQNYQLGNFDVYKFSLDGSPIPDVDKAAHGDIGSNSCWEAAASNVLAAAGYGIGAGGGATSQQRADHIYTQLTTDLGTANLGCADRAINYWLYTYGKNPNSPEYMPTAVYTDVTVMSGPVPLSPYVAPPALNVGYNFLLDELKRCQYVLVGFENPAHCMTLVGGNYWNNPNNRPDGNKSIWHDSDGPNSAPPGGGDHPDTVTHPMPVGANIDDDVYTNQPDSNGFWTLADYWSVQPTSYADRYITLCPGLNKPQEAVENYDAAYYLQAKDPDKILDDPAFRVAGLKAPVYGSPAWYDETVLWVPNEYVPDWHKEVYLLVDYFDRVPGRDEDVKLLVPGEAVGRDPTSVTASEDDGQLLFTWSLDDLDHQPAWEKIVFPNNHYRLLDNYVKDWDVATLCVPEPATIVLLVTGLLCLVGYWRRDR